MQGRLRQLDAIRAIAVLLVIGCHWRQFVHIGTFHALDALFRRGWVGVDLFFVLSGFLVSGLLFREYQRCGSVDVVRFFIRRGLKIYPGFYALFFISLAGLLFGLLPTHHVTNWRVFHEAIFLQNYHAGLWNHTWSLAVEEHFYLMLGLCICLAARRNKSKNPFRKMALIVVIVCVSCTVLRFATYRIMGYDWFRIYAPTHLRVDSLLFGVLISYLYHFRREAFEQWVNKNRWYMLIAATVLTAAGLMLNAKSLVMVTAGIPCLYIGFGSFLVLSLIVGAKYAKSNSKPLVALSFVGEHSYSIYLWHMPVLFWSPLIIHRVAGLDLDPVTRFFIYVAGSIAIGIIMAKIIELPALRIRDRLYPSRSSG